MTLKRTNGGSGRVVVVGLDMGDGVLVRHWIASGALPNLASCVAEGAWVDLDSPAEVLHTSTWPTFATGTLPGTHGVYYPFQPRPGYQQAQHIEPDQYGVPSFWKIADDRGLRCLIYDVPETFPEPGFSGEAIFELGTWAWYGRRKTQPDGLLTDLQAKFGDYPLGLEAAALGLGRLKSSKLQVQLAQSIEYKRKTLQWLMGRQDWDLVVTAFCETHPAAHYLWPAGARDVSTTDDASFAPMRGIYQAIDAALGELRAKLPQDATLLVVSGDGVRPNNAGWHLLPRVLESMGFMNARPTASGGAPKPASFLGRVKSSVPPGARRWIADHMPRALREKVGAHIQASAIDWAYTRAFPLPTDLEGCIRINLKGREPDGIVEPGDEYRQLCADLRARLLTLVNGATGRPAVRAVWIRDEVFPGKRSEHLPDVVVSWNDEAPISSIEAPGIPRLEEPSPDPRTGTHSTRGFMIACGRGVRQANTRGHLVQVAPTVLSLLDIEEGLPFDGAPIDLSQPTVTTSKS